MLKMSHPPVGPLPPTHQTHYSGSPTQSLRGQVYGYQGYWEALKRPVYRLVAARPYVVIILGFGDKLPVHPVGQLNQATGYQSFVAGLQAPVLVSQHQGERGCLEIQLHPAAAYRLFGEAATYDSDALLTLEQLWGHDLPSLVQQLADAPSWSARITQVNQVLNTKLQASNRSIRPEIRWVWNQLRQQDGTVTIGHLADAIGWSHRYFDQCFRRYIGTTPKAAARRLRFAKAQDLLMAPDDLALCDIALACGYSDQSHLNREFRHFAGCSPGQYKMTHQKAV
jgi:AraC-like DNA-binding protein